MCPYSLQTIRSSEVIENAYIVDFWDVDKMVEIILDLISNPSKLKELQEKVRVEVKKFTWLEPAQKIKKIYAELLRNP